MDVAETSLDLAVDVDALARRLRADGIDVAGALSATRIGRGQSNLTYLVEDEQSRRWIVRRPPRGHLLASAHDVEREFRILSALQGTAVPVPGIVASITDLAVADAPVVVMEYIDGLVVDRMDIVDGMDLSVRAEIGLDLARTMAAVHDVDLDAVGLGDLASHAPYAERQLKRWSRQWEQSRTRNLPALDAMTDLLRAKIPTQRALTLVHGDLHIRNVIADPATGRIRAVLDWELTTLGDPLADIGSLLAYWPEPSDPPTGLFAASTMPGFVDRATLAQAYLYASGRDGADLDYWHVFGLWKIAVICEGVLRRAIDDPRNAADGGPPKPEFIDQLVEKAWHIARTAQL